MGSSAAQPPLPLVPPGPQIGSTSRKPLAAGLAWIAVRCFASVCVLSNLSPGGVDPHDRFERLADKVFLAGTAILLVAVLVLAVFDL